MPASKVEHHKFTSTASAYTIIGRANEDRFTLATLNDTIQMYGVYDGHGGKLVPEYLVENLSTKFADAFVDVNFADEEQIKKIIEEVFIQVDETIDKDTRSGATCTVAFRNGNKLYVANVGDSRAIIFDSEGKVLLETPDHDGNNKSEQNRVKAAGGFVHYGRLEGHIAVTRSFGDFEYKHSGKKHDEYDPRGKMSIIPDVHVCEIDSGTLLLATDGLWDGEYEKSINVVKMIQGLSTDLDLNQRCEAITKKGYENYHSWIKDDITVILVQL